MSEGHLPEKPGYGRPPKSGRFKKGKSGNPAGRPKGSKNLSTVLEKTLAERVAVNENGRQTSISKLEATVKQLVNRAAGGDAKHMHQVFALSLWLEGDQAALDPPQAALSDADREVIEFVYRRLKSRTLSDDNV